MKATKLLHLLLFAAAIFFVGFILGAKTPEPKWVGYLVFGKKAPEPYDKGILIPPPDPLVSSVDSAIMIGLREDGVVVWKQQENKKKDGDVWWKVRDNKKPEEDN